MTSDDEDQQQMQAKKHQSSSRDIDKQHSKKKLTPKSRRIPGLAPPSSSAKSSRSVPSSKWDHSTPIERSKPTTKRATKKAAKYEPMDSTRKRDLLSSSSSDDEDRNTNTNNKKIPRTPWSTDCDIDSPFDPPPSATARTAKTTTARGSGPASSRKKKRDNHNVHTPNRSIDKSGRRGAVFEFSSNDENDDPKFDDIVKKRQLSPKFISKISKNKKRKG
jgi:hypothetical protein